MNYFRCEPFYGIGFGIQLVEDAVVPDYEDYFDGDVLEVEREFNGVMIDFLCFRFLIGKVGDVQS